MPNTILTLALALFSLSLWAQSPGPVETVPVSQSADSTGVRTVEKAGYYFPVHAAVTMADGSFKPISTVQAGDEVKCYHNGQFVTSRVQQVDIEENTCATVTELYLRPVDERTASRSTWPLVPALLLEVAPGRLVQTVTGPKAVCELVKGDILYRYESATGEASAWKVGIIQANVRSLSKVYNLMTETGSYLVENMVVLDR